MRRIRRGFPALVVVAATSVLVATGSVAGVSLSAAPGMPSPPVAASPSGPVGALVGVLDPITGPREQRSGGTTTTLRDGRVLLVGGSGPKGASVRSVMVWDPVSETFTRAGRLPVETWAHTATLLTDGRVLIVGGYTGNVSLGTSYLWDPTTSRVRRAGTLRESRQGHAALLLPDGRVLVVGGYHTRPRRPHGGHRQSELVSAEIWDPATERFSSAGSIALRAQEWSAGGVLPDGRAVVIGMSFRKPWRTAAEVWDPTTAAFSPAWRLADREGLRDTVLLPDGRMLLVVANEEGTCSTRVELDEACRDHLDLWDPETGTLAPTGPLADPRGWRGHAATLVADGSVIIFGGGRPCLDRGGRLLPPPPPCDPEPFTVERWDPATGMSVAIGTAPDGALGVGDPVLLSDGRVLLPEGLVWDPTSSTFARTPSVSGMDVVALRDGGALVVTSGEIPQRWYRWRPAS